MMDFGTNELYVRAVMSQKQREAGAVYRVAEFTQPPRGVRATVATRLAHLAVHLDRETTDKLVGKHLKTAGRHG